YARGKLSPLQHDTVRRSAGGGEILVKKVLTPSFGEPFALKK
ncbi:unnamed protein product, partial [Porites evermanni]